MSAAGGRFASRVTDATASPDRRPPRTQSINPEKEVTVITTRTLDPEDPTTMVQTSVAVKKDQTACVRRIFTKVTKEAAGAGFPPAIETDS